MLEVVDHMFKLECMGTTSIDKSNLVVIPTHMIKNILIVHCDLILSSVGKFGC